MRRFLVGVDFSDRSSRAEDRALRLAAHAGAELVAVHIIDNDLPPRIAAAAVDEASERAAAFAAHGAAAGVSSRLTTVRGEAHVELPRLAHEAAASCIILGSHRQSPERNAFVGTTADRILRASGHPVLVVRGEAADNYKAALAAVDIFEPDLGPVSAAVDLGIVDRGRVTVGFAVETDAMRRLKLEAASLEAVAQVFALDEAALGAEAERLAAGARLSGDAVVLRPLLLNAADCVMKMAAERRADLLVLGSRRKDAEHRQPLGSVSETLLRRAAIDVLVVPAR